MINEAILFSSIVNGVAVKGLLMIVFILALLAGCVPSLIVFFWFWNALNKENDLYRKNCNSMLASGFLTTFPVMLLSGCIVLLLHGLYDFSLTKEIETLTDASGFIAVTLAVLDLVIIIALIIFIRKNKNNTIYTEPLEQEKAI